MIDSLTYQALKHGHFPWLISYYERVIKNFQTNVEISLSSTITSSWFLCSWTSMSHNQPTGSSGFATDLRPILTMPGASQDFQTTHRPMVRLFFGCHVCHVHLIHSLPRFGAGTQPGHGVSPANQKKSNDEIIPARDPKQCGGAGG